MTAKLRLAVTAALVYVSSSEERWRSFRRPIVRLFAIPPTGRRDHHDLPSPFEQLVDRLPLPRMKSGKPEPLPQGQVDVAHEREPT